MVHEDWYEPVATSGFDAVKISAFEDAKTPIDIYGIGSAFFAGGNNDFTLDVVEVKVDGKWLPMAKEGRDSKESADLKRVELFE